MNFDYLRQGSRAIPTASSFLISSSQYLNNPTLRDWLSTHFLRRNGVDQPTPADATLGLIQAMEQIRDVDRIQALIDRERELNPKFKKWIDARFLSDMTKEDFAKFDPDTLGGAYYKYLTAFGLDINVGSTLRVPKNDLEYILSRVVQTHDFIHLLTGSQFNTLGEVTPAFAQVSNMHQHITAELSHFFCEYHLFVGMRWPMRSCLHYPTTWMTVMDMMRRAISIGFASESFLMMPYEEAMHLPIAKARDALGVRNAVDIDATREDEVYTEQRAPSDAELTQIGRPDLAQIRL